MWSRSTAVLEHTPSGNRRVHKIAIAVIAAAVTSVFYINFCNLVYQCGCRSLWNGADAMCNIHSHTARHCPWCAIGMAGSVAVWAVIVGAQVLIALRSKPMHPLFRGGLALAAFPIVGGGLA